MACDQQHDPRARDEDKTHIVLPPKLVKSDGVHILIEDEGQGDGEVEDGETLCAEMERQNFDGVRDNEWRVCDVVASVEQEDSSNDSISSGVRSSLGVLGRADSLHDEEDQHANVGA